MTMDSSASRSITIHNFKQSTSKLCELTMSQGDYSAVPLTRMNMSTVQTLLSAIAPVSGSQ